MPVSSKDLADLIAAPPSGLNRGTAMSMQRRASSYGPDAAPKAAVFLNKFLEQPLPDGNVGRHPGNAVKMTADDLRRAESGEAEPLSDTERAWLERLPRDPAAVPFDDAVELAGLAQRFSPM